MIARGVPVAHDEGVDLVGIEKGGDVFAFARRGEVRVAAAGEDDDRGSGNVLACEDVGIDGGNGGVGVGIGALDYIRGVAPERSARDG